jgi:hypothetical protein
MRTRNTLGRRLRQQGFDLTTYDRSTGYYRPRCSQCNALVINGVACHEHGCPNQRKAERDD